MKEREFQLEIWRFVTGKLTEMETDQLFVEILKEPKWMEYLESVKIQYDLCQQPQVRNTSDSRQRK